MIIQKYIPLYLVFMHKSMRDICWGLISSRTHLNFSYPVAYHSDERATMQNF